MCASAVSELPTDPAGWAQAGVGCSVRGHRTSYRVSLPDEVRLSWIKLDKANKSLGKIAIHNLIEACNLPVSFVHVPRSKAMDLLHNNGNPCTVLKPIRLSHYFA